MPVDFDRYQALIARAAADFSFYKGHVQDCSRNQRAMTLVGGPRWSRVNGWPAFHKIAANDRTVSGVIPSVIDSVAAPFWCEFLFKTPPSPAGVPYLFYQYGNGGWNAYYDAANTRIRIATWTAVGGAARDSMSAIGSAPALSLVHAVGCIDTVALTGLWWIKGIPSAGAFTNTAPPVLCVPCVLNAPGTGGLGMQVLISRVWQGTPSNADASCLAEAARLLVGGW